MWRHLSVRLFDRRLRLKSEGESRTGKRVLKALTSVPKSFSAKLIETRDWHFVMPLATAWWPGEVRHTPAMSRFDSKHPGWLKRPSRASAPFYPNLSLFEPRSLFMSSTDVMCWWPVSACNKYETPSPVRGLFDRATWHTDFVFLSASANCLTPKSVILLRLRSTWAY